MNNAFVLLDRHRCFIDANVAAKKLLPQLAVLSALIKSADTALYAAKRSGRDAACLYHSGLDTES